MNYTDIQIYLNYHKICESGEDHKNFKFGTILSTWCVVLNSIKMLTFLQSKD